ATCEDQLPIGLLDEGPEEAALDLESGVMDQRLDPVGEPVILFRHGQGHLKLELERGGRAPGVDGGGGEGSLEAVSVARGESPYWTYGGSSCVFSPIRRSRSFPQAQVARVKPSPVLCHHP